MKEFSTPSQGMITDLDSVNLNENSYIYALNANLESNTGDGFVLQNDYSNLLGAVFLEGEDIIGKEYISGLDILILFTTKNRILSLSSKLYSDATMNQFDFQSGSVALSPDNSTEILNIKVLAQSDCFNWNINNKVKIEHKITDYTLNLYFFDNGRNEDRYIYFNLSDLAVEDSFKRIIGYDDYQRPIYIDEIDCNKLKWYSEISYPEIITKEREGGNLKAGVYQFLVAYSTSKGIPLTPYKGATNPFPLFTKQLTVDTDYNTGRAIEVIVNDIDISGRYRWINLVVVKTINEVTTYSVVGTFPIDNSISYTYTGNNKEIPTDEQQVFQIFPYYRSSAGGVKANNKLFKYGVKEFEKFNLQPIVNKIKLKWYTIIAKEGDYKDPEFAQKYRCYLRDEIYMFGLKFILDNGEETQVYTLCGRALNLDDRLIVVNNDDVIQDTTCLTDGVLNNVKRKWEVYNTAYVTKTGSNTEYDPCNHKIYQEGEFGYWQSTETYPNIPEEWGDMAGRPIRGFRMPDCLVSPIHNGDGQNKLNYTDDNLMYPLGVKFDDSTDIQLLLQEAVNQSLITEAQRDRIRGYKIVRGNRVGNESVIAKGWMSDVWVYTDKTTPTYYANHGFNDLRTDPYLVSRDLRRETAEFYIRRLYRVDFIPVNRYTFHSPNTSFRQPSLGNILKVENEIFGTAKGFFSQSRGYGEYVILSQLQYNFAIIMGHMLTSRLELEKAQPGSQGSAIGSSIGGIVGGVVGSFVAGVGAAGGAVIGSGLGGIIGKLIGGQTADDDYNAMYRLSMWISQTDRILELMFNTIPMVNYHWQHQAVGKYNNVEPVENSGRKQREILNSAYIDGTRQLLPNNTSFNNNYRESAVYLELSGDLGRTKNQDTSKYDSKKPNGDCYEENEEIYSNVSSFYGSIKRNVLNQYNNIYSIDWIPVSGKMWRLDEKAQEFGGDTFINRFAFKRSHAFFSNTSFHLPDRTDIYYEDLSNIAYPMYFFNTKYTELGDPASISMKFMSGIENAYPVLLGLNNLESPQTVTNNNIPWNTVKGVQDAIGELFKKSLMNPYVTTRPGRYTLDCASDNFFEKRDPRITGDQNDYIVIPTSTNWWKDTFGEGDVDKYVPNVVLTFGAQQGRIYTYNHAIPYFMCESDFNLEYRHAEDANEKDFYPHQTNLDYWLQEENVNPRIDNVYTYNRTYSKQNKEEINLKTDVNFIKEKSKISYPNRIIYSQDGAEVENSEFKDNYLYFKPLDSFDFTYENGKLISVDSIESEQVLVRFENNTRIFNAFNTIQTDGASIALGSGSLFGIRPQEFSKTDLGYIGSQHSEMLNTEFGHIIVDAKRGNVFSIQPGGKGIDELAKDGMKNWMIENLPFKISKYFKDINIDNTYNHIGISLSYDKRYKRFFLTKLDYIPKFKDIVFRDNKFYYREVEIDVRNPNFFCNASWTISYSFYKKSWTSFHSFTPDYYIDGLNVFYSGLNGSGLGISSLWIHNLTNKSYQTYYGKLHPFEIELLTKLSGDDKVLKSISYLQNSIRYHNEYDKAEIDTVTFNKAIVGNEYQNSGLLELAKISENSLKEMISFPKKEVDRTKIVLKKTESFYSFNQFKDLTRKNNLPRFINSCNNVNKMLNLEALDYSSIRINNNYIRSLRSFVRLINDKNDKHKIIFRGLIVDSIPSIK